MIVHGQLDAIRLRGGQQLRPLQLVLGFDHQKLESKLTRQGEHLPVLLLIPPHGRIHRVGREAGRLHDLEFGGVDVSRIRRINVRPIQGESGEAVFRRKRHHLFKRHLATRPRLQAELRSGPHRQRTGAE